MRLLPCALALMLPVVLAAQEKDEWRRVAKYEDGSYIELNASRVTFGGGEVGRVRVRVVWAKPQSLKGAPAATYKTHLETVEFKCRQRQFRSLELTLLDPTGKPVYSYEGPATGAWVEVKPKTMPYRILEPACAMIEEKRRNPDAEPQS
jgi:hypothetical protein